jgi:hypothetical protein
MDAGGRIVCVAVLLAGMTFAWGCAAPQKAAKPGEPPPFSVHLPAMEATDVDVRAQPPAVQPELALPPPHPSASGVEEGKARSLEMIRIERGGAKPHKPAEDVPPEAGDRP